MKSPAIGHLALIRTLCLLYILKLNIHSSAKQRLETMTLLKQPIIGILVVPPENLPSVLVQDHLDHSQLMGKPDPRVPQIRLLSLPPILPL